MSRPTLITVQGTYLKLDGTPDSGTVTFRSPVFDLAADDASIMSPGPLKADLDNTGSFSLQVPASNDPDWSPEGWTYTVHVKVTSGAYMFKVMVPFDAPDATLNMNKLLPSVDSDGNLYAAYNHTHDGIGGGGNDPATTVVSETTYGQSAAVGVGTKYARNDHTHGTPALPTPAGIGAAPTVHTHAAGDVTSGTFAIGRIPTGTSGTTVALGNDSRFSDARTPTAHASSHAAAGSDPITISESQVTNLVTDLAAKAPTASPTFTGTVSGISKSMVGLGNVDNTSDVSKPISTATQTALDGKASTSHTHTQSDVTGLTTALAGKADTSSLATVATTGDYDDLINTPTIPTASVTSVAGKTGDVTLVKADVGLANVDNTSDANKPVSTATQTALDGKAATVHSHAISDVTSLQTALDAKAPLASPTFTGTVAGITKAMVGLGNVDNTADSAKPVSTAQQTALDLKAPLASPTFTGTVSGISKSMVGLGNVDNTADTAKPISTAQQAALDLKAPLASPTFTGTVAGISKSMVGLSNVDNTSDANKPVSSAQQTALNLKAPLASPTFTGTVSGITKSMVGLGNVDNTADSAKSFTRSQISDIGAKVIVLNVGDPIPGGTPSGTVVVRI